MSPFEEIVTDLFICGYVVTTVLSIIYAYGKLNYEYNYKDGIKVSHREWLFNRNIVIIVAISLNIVIAFYLFIEYGYPSRSRKTNFTLFKSKEDPLYHQVVEEKPNSFWHSEDPSGLAANVKRIWRQIWKYC